MTSPLVFKGMNAAHRVLVAISFGKVGWSTGSMKVLQLTTIGRKTGQPRSVMLTAPVQEGDTWVIVASRNGDDIDPAWLHNLRDNPDVEVSLQGKPKQAMRARVATPEERARLWPTITSVAKNYAGYQKKTEREIPVVLLEPKA